MDYMISQEGGDLDGLLKEALNAIRSYSPFELTQLAGLLNRYTFPKKDLVLGILQLGRQWKA